MHPIEDITDWADRIEHAIGVTDDCCVSEAVVYQRVASTQDAAFRHRNESGVVVIASEQTEGRGRRGRRWDDGQAATLPVSFAIRTDLDDVSLAARAGLAALNACADRLSGEDVLIKWPNDVVVRTESGDRKLGGVLIERRDDTAIIGIGINVRPIGPIDDHQPIAFEDLGVHADRCDLAIGLVQQMSVWLGASDDAVRSAWAKHDAMVGTERTFLVGNEVVCGEVIAIDPLTSITVRDKQSERVLPVAQARTV